MLLITLCTSNKGGLRFKIINSVNLSICNIFQVFYDCFIRNGFKRREVRDEVSCHNMFSRLVRTRLPRSGR